jgi:glycosyltransferase involved in cell wall biosynthesis
VGNNVKYKFLLINSDKFPPFRVDVAVLFGKEFIQSGHEIHWLLQSEADCSKSYTTQWRGNQIFVGTTDNGKSTLNRIKKYLLRYLHSLRMFPLAWQNQYDFIQVKDLFMPAVLAIILSKVKKIPFYFWLSFPFPESHLFSYKSKTSKFRKFHLLNGIFTRILLYKIILPAADHVFAQSEQMKSDLMVEGIQGEKITPVPMGIEVNDADLVSEQMLQLQNDSEKKILYLGTMVRVRRLDFLLRVFKLIQKEEIPSKLYMVGDSDNPQDLIWLKEIAENLGISKKVIFTGNLPRKEAFEYVRQADVCLSPFAPIPILNSTSPTKLVEYLYWGKATVANDHPEQRRVIAESGSGICVPYDEKAFADAVITLLKNDALARQMGRDGRAYMLAHRDYSIIAARLEETYSELLKKRSKKTVYRKLVQDDEIYY